MWKRNLCSDETIGWRLWIYVCMYIFKKNIEIFIKRCFDMMQVHRGKSKTLIICPISIYLQMYIVHIYILHISKNLIIFFKFISLSLMKFIVLYKDSVLVQNNWTTVFFSRGKIFGSLIYSLEGQDCLMLGGFKIAKHHWLLNGFSSIQRRVVIIYFILYSILGHNDICTMAGILLSSLWYYKNYIYVCTYIQICE